MTSGNFIGVIIQVVPELVLYPERDSFQFFLNELKINKKRVKVMLNEFNFKKHMILWLSRKLFTLVGG